MIKESDERKKERNKIIADNITKYMKRNNISTKQLSILTGISESCLRNYKTGIRLPDNYRLVKIAKALQVTIRDLKTGFDDIILKIENIIISYNLSEIELKELLNTLYDYYCKLNKYKVTEITSNINNIFEICRNEINKYFEENNYLSDITSYSFLLLENISLKKILSYYSIPIYSYFNYCKNQNQTILFYKHILRENNSNYDDFFGLYIDSTDYTYSYEYGTILILKKDNIIFEKEIGLILYTNNLGELGIFNEIELLRVDSISHYKGFSMSFTSIQEFHQKLPYTLTEKNISKYNMKLLGKVYKIILPSTKETNIKKEFYKFKN